MGNHGDSRRDPENQEADGHRRRRIREGQGQIRRQEARWLQECEAPVSGSTFGPIVGGAYVPCKALEGDSPDLKDWANVVYCDGLFQDVTKDLDAHYDHAVSLQIYCAAILRVCCPGIKGRELKGRYDSSFLSEAYPGVALSRNTVSSLFSPLGKNVSRIVAFMRKRAEACVVDDHLLVDGTLKNDENCDISALYAFDLERREPICSQRFLSNMLDLTAYSDFIERNGIKMGIIVADKGFPSSAAGVEFATNPTSIFSTPWRGTRGSRRPTACTPTSAR